MRLALPVVLMLALAACAQSPARTPVIASGSLQGQLQAGIYQDKNDWFSIGTPLAPTDPHYTQLSVSENYPPNVSYINFSLLTSPGEYYRAYVEDFYASNHQVPTLDRLADLAMKVLGMGITQQRLEPMRLIETKPWQAGATTGLLRLYTERTPAGTLSQDPLWMAEDYTAYILLYVTARSGKVAVLWSEWPTGCSVCAPDVPGPAATGDDPIDKALAADGRAKQFMDSFHFQAQ